MRLKKEIIVFLGMILTMQVMPIFAEVKEEKQEINQVKEIVEEKAVTDISQYENQELLIIYKDDIKEEEKQEIINEITVQKREVVTDWCDEITLEKEVSLETIINLIAEKENVLYVQPNFHYSMAGTSSSFMDIANITESDFTKQWWIYNDGSFQEPEDVKYESFWPSYGDYLPFQNIVSNNSIWDSLFETKIKAVTGIDTNTARAWQEFTTGGRKTIIAVIDTGIDYTHSQLKDSIWVNTAEIPGNGIDDDGNGYIDDIYGWNFYHGSNEVYVGTTKIRGGKENEDEHGTHVAGVIAAAKDGIGIAGIASNTDIELMSLKVLGGREGSGETADIVKAIVYAEKQGAVICNMSFGINQIDIPFYYQDYDKALKEAVKKSSMLFVTASGNEGSDNDIYDVYPSSYDYDNIISVANLRCDGTLSSYSNYGEKSVDLAAPGMYIYSTVPGEKYDYMSGTSMSTPMVTAACAMGYAYAKNPDILAVRERLLANITRLSSLYKKVSTSGILNVYDTVKDLAENAYTYTGGSSIIEPPTETIPGNNIENTDNSFGDIENNTTNTDSKEPSEEITAEDMIGKKFIQDGIIYKILSDSTAEATGAEYSTSKKLTIKSSVTYQTKTYKVTKIKEKAFYKNQSVVQVKIGSNIKTIGKSAFIGCKKLKKVIGMDFVEKIKKNAFRNCKKLQSIKLTQTVTEIADSAFRGCENLKVKTVKGSYAASYVKQEGIKASYQ